MVFLSHLPFVSQTRPRTRQNPTTAEELWPPRPKLSTRWCWIVKLIDIWNGTKLCYIIAIVFSVYSLFIEKVHERPEDSLSIHSRVAPLDGAFHLNQLLVHLLHTVLNHTFKTGKLKTGRLKIRCSWLHISSGCSEACVEEVSAHSCWSCLIIEKMLGAVVSFVQVEMLNDLLCSLSMRHSKGLSQLHPEQNTSATNWAVWCYSFTGR